MTNQEAMQDLKNKIDKWQIELINKITSTHPDYDNDLALSLANQWRETDEKWLMVTDQFCIYNTQERLVDMIERKFEKILKDNETKLDENAQSWLWICDQMDK